MLLERLALIAEIVGSVAIVVTLVYLSVRFIVGRAKLGAPPLNPLPTTTKHPTRT